MLGCPIQSMPSNSRKCRDVCCFPLWANLLLYLKACLTLFVFALEKLWDFQSEKSKHKGLKMLWSKESLKTNENTASVLGVSCGLKINWLELSGVASCFLVLVFFPSTSLPVLTGTFGLYACLWFVRISSLYIRFVCMFQFAFV